MWRIKKIYTEWISFQITPEVRKKLEIISETEGIQMSEFIREGIKINIERYELKKGVISIPKT